MRINRFISFMIVLVSFSLMTSCFLQLGMPEEETEDDLNSRQLVTVLNGNEPYFDEEDYSYAQEKGFFIELSELDELGRVGTAWTLLEYDQMPPSGSRDFTIDTTPTGWVQNRYSTDIVEGGWLYNRSHLIGYQLSGIEDEPRDLMTGTRMFNTPGMLEFEDMTADHMRDNRTHHVLYRVTPDFGSDNLLAYGVTMESDCLECDGADYCVYIANIQPSIVLDYSTGDNWQSGTDTGTEDPSALPDAVEYVVNKSNDKFHLPSCRYVDSIGSGNRLDIKAPRDWMIANGYDPCGVCNP